MKRIPAAALAVVLASCASPPENDTLNRWSPPTAIWNGNETATLPLDTVSLNGRVVFFGVELSIDGYRETFLVDSGSSSTSFTDEFLRILKSKISGGQNGVVYGLGWSRKVNTIVIDSLDLGFARLKRLEIPNEDILGTMFYRQVISKNGRPLAGIIGVDMLVALGASIDLGNSTITFRKMPNRPPDPTPPPSMPPAGRESRHG